MKCENCGSGRAKIRRETEHHPEYFFCSEKCAVETAKHYSAGRGGYYGMTTREAVECDAKRKPGDPCYCWTSEGNRIGTVIRGETVVHSTDCPNGGTVQVSKEREEAQALRARWTPEMVAGELAATVLSEHKKCTCGDGHECSRCVAEYYQEITRTP